MTTTDVSQYLAATPGRIGQGTAVEQSRAIAEVQAAIVVAQQCPRDTQQAIREMADACKQLALAERAFFRYSRGGGAITGPSIHLARELARAWGNIQYGITELRRDDSYRQSEMQAWAWDVQTNARSSNTFIVPHMRDTKDGAKALTDMRDIYENNANNGARRLRETIFAVLPIWFVETAKDACNQTLRNGGGKPLPQRITEAISGFAAIGVNEGQLEDKLGNPSAKWTEHDVATLGVIYKSIQRGEMRVEEEFPREQAAGRVTVTEIVGSEPAKPAQRKGRRGKQDDAPASSDGGESGPAEPEQPAQDALMGEDEVTVEDPPDTDWPPVTQPGEGGVR